MKKDFGYSINADRQIDFDALQRDVYRKIEQLEPSIRACISCGTCSATCSAAQFTDFSLRRYILLIRRGDTTEVKKKINQCMLCGKCQLACPMGVNTRNLIFTIQNIINQN